MRCEEALGVSCGVGAVSGGIVGFSLGVWTAVAIVQPAFASIPLSPAAASGITAAIFLCGGIESFIAAGVVAGAIATPVVAGAGACLAVTGAAIYEGVSTCVSNNSFRFFEQAGTNTSVQTQQPVATTENGNSSSLEFSKV